MHPVIIYDHIVNRLSISLAITIALSCAALGASAKNTQQRAKPPAIVVQAKLQVGGAAYTADGPGECIFSNQSSMYDVPGSQWGVRHSGANQNVNLSFWRLSKGGDMFTLSVSVGGKTHQVNTMQVGPPANRKGSGRVTFEKRGAGGVFNIEAQSDSGAKITGQLTCSGFTKPEENG
jgi:hypothetical protein